ncbi:putative ribonuclease H-like domain-containing protein, partial [Tanacetum coccineum]
MHAVPPPITGTFMPPSNKPDIDDTQFTYGSKSNNCVETNSVSNDFVSCDNSDKSSDSESAGFASCASSVNSSSTMTNASSSVDLKNLYKTDDQGPSNDTQSPSFSFKKNVKTPRNLCNRNGSNNISLCKNKSFSVKKCFVCGSKFHLIRDCDFYENQLRLNNAPVWKNVENIPSFVPRPAYVPTGSRNRPTSVPAGRSFPAGRPFPTGWHNPAARPMTRPKSHYFQQFSRPGSYNQMAMDEGRWGTADNPHTNKDIGIVDSGCSRSMTGNKEKLADFVKIKGGTVTFGGGDGKITGKGTIRTSNFNFENVYYVEELQNFNLFSVSQICDTKNKVLFTDSECLVLSKEFKLPDSSQVVLRVPRRHNLYCFNLAHIHPEREIKCLLAKASLDESTKWHRRMAHVNFKNMNKLAKHGLVNGLPSKLFTNEHNCVACNKGKQHKASYKAITAVSTISEPLQLLHMDLFGPTSIRSHCSQVPIFGVMVTLAGTQEILTINAVKDTWNTADMVPAVSAIPATSILAGSINQAAGVSAVHSTPSSSMVEPVHDTPLPPGYSLGSSENSTRFPSPSDLANHISSSSEMEGIHHLHTTGIISESSYDADLWLWSQGHRQEEGIDYDEELPYLYGEINEEVICTQPKGFEIFFTLNIVQSLVKSLYGLHQEPRPAWCDEFEVLMKGEFEMSAMGELTFFLGLQVIQKSNGIFISQDKYVQDMLTKFDMVNVRSATTPFEATTPKSKEEPDEAVNIHLYRSMIGSLMYLTALRPDIQFAVSACSRHQVTPLTSHLNAVKRIFKYLKGRPKLGLWYPRDSPFVLEAYSDSDYAGSHGDRKSTTGGCQFLGRRLISWQCKKQTIVATSSTEAEYVAAANCCGQCLFWCCLRFYGGYTGFSDHEQFLLVVLLVSAGRVVPAGFVNCLIGHGQPRVPHRGKADNSQEQILTSVEVPDSHSLALFKYKVRELGSITLSQLKYRPAKMMFCSAKYYTDRPDRQLSPEVTQFTPKPSAVALSNVSSHPDVPPKTSVDPTVTPTPPCATPVSRSSGPRTRSKSFDADIKTYRPGDVLASRKMPSFEVDLDAPDASFIQVLTDDDSDDSADNTDPLFWHIFVAWEVIPTGLGDVNALYFTDKTSKYCTHLREILHLIDRQDLSKLFGMVVKMLNVDVWNDQQEWVIHSWKLFPFSGVHVLETFSGKILYMFADTPYPLSVSLMRKMLKANMLEVDGRWLYVVPTGRVIATDSVIVATSGYVVPAAYDINPGEEGRGESGDLMFIRAILCGILWNIKMAPLSGRGARGGEEFRQREQAANMCTHTLEPSRCFNSFYDDDDYEESTIPLNEIISQIPPSIAIIPVLPTMEPKDSLIIGDEELSTIPEKESDEFIRSSVEDLVPIPCMNIANIIRKEPKPDKKEHETERVHKSRKFSSK